MTKRNLINFTGAMEYVWNKVEKKKIAVLSTAAGNRVTSRTVSFIRLGDNLYFQTDERFLKTRQIRKNKNVAVCLDNIQLEAEAEIRGHSSLPVNRDFVEKYKKKHPGSHKAYTKGRHQAVVRLELKLITIWKYLGGPRREFIWPQQKKAEVEVYDVNSNGPLYIPEISVSKKEIV
ncbi:MAG: pyridoxamine 5'-phosphate oxidase family protein [Spirochaetales bacterium]|nr:pyridoxamine 5'-phosphate oxidase family protein [Spirochaetales bacterium]